MLTVTNVVLNFQNGALVSVACRTVVDDIGDIPPGDNDNNFGGNQPVPVDPEYPPGTNRLSEYHKDCEAFRSN